MTEVIRVTDLSKSFKLYARAKDRIKEWVSLSNKKYHQDFRALKNLSFSISTGETLGILGRNGSGKSTLLQILSGVMRQTSGEKSVQGRISALLELGTGFDQELTGRENLYLSGSIMGFSREETKVRIPMIEEFADIGEFIDQPVKVYSSGMYVRLAFSQAIHVDPDILIIDEALAVGDVKFQNKCYRKFREFKEQNKTVIFVTHSTDLVAKHCDRAILLEEGRLMADDHPNEVINRYLDLLFGVQPVTAEQKEKKAVTVVPATSIDNSAIDDHPRIRSFCMNHSVEDNCALNPTYNQNEYRWGDQSCRINDYMVLAGDRINPSQVNASENINIYIKYYFSRDVERPIFGLTLKTLDGVEVFGSNSKIEDLKASPREKDDISVVKFQIPANLISGEYFISVGLAEFVDGDTIPLDRRYDMIHLKIYNSSFRYGIVDMSIQITEIL